MRDQPRDELWYEIVPIKLDPSCDWSCNFMTLQLPLFLDVSSNKHVGIWDHDFSNEKTF